MASSEKEEKKVDLEEKVSEEKNTEKVEEIKKRETTQHWGNLAKSAGRPGTERHIQLFC